MPPKKKLGGAALNELKTINLKQFDMSKIKRDKVVVLIGKRGTGKSCLTKDILFNHKDIPVAVVVSGSERVNAFYSHMIPDLYIYDNYKEEIVESLLKRQVKAENNSWTEKNAILIFDDCLYDNAWVKDTKIREVFMNGRHYNLMFILTMQYAMGIPPALRTNIDYVFIFRDNIHSNKRRLWEHYAGIFPTYEMFNEVFEECTRDFGCLVIDNQSKSSNIEDVVFWYKAQFPLPEFKVGSFSYWKSQQEVEEQLANEHKKKERERWLAESRKQYERKWIVNKDPEVVENSN